jgi:hypothetical protein
MNTKLDLENFAMYYGRNFISVKKLNTRWKLTLTGASSEFNFFSISYYVFLM